MKNIFLDHQFDENFENLIDLQKKQNLQDKQKNRHLQQTKAIKTKILSELGKLPEKPKRQFCDLFLQAFC